MPTKELAMILAVISLSAAVLAGAQTPQGFVPEFKLLCHPTDAVMDVSPNDPSADPFGNGPWYVNESRSNWAAWQPLVSSKAGNRILWIKPRGAKIEITGKRLDGESEPLKVESTGAYLEKGFEPNRLYFPVPGCWEVTATAGEEELVFVVEVKAPANK
jgi:hypothetical protein